MINLSEQDILYLKTIKKKYGKAIACEYEKDIYLYYITKKIDEMNDPLIVFRGSYIYRLTITGYKRSPNDLDFSYNIQMNDENKATIVRNIISSIDERVILRRNETSFSQYGFLPYESLYGKNLTQIKIESMIRSPLVSEIEQLEIYHPVMQGNQPLNINVYSKEQLFIDKILSINFLKSKYNKGNKERLYDAIYDSAMLMNSNYLNNFFRTKKTKIIKEKILADMKIHYEQFLCYLNDSFFLKNKYEFKIGDLISAKKHIANKGLSEKFSIIKFTHNFKKVRNNMRKMIDYDEVKASFKPS